MWWKVRLCLYYPRSLRLGGREFITSLTSHPKPPHPIMSSCRSADKASAQHTRPQRLRYEVGYFHHILLQAHRGSEIGPMTTSLNGFHLVIGNFPDFWSLCWRDLTCRWQSVFYKWEVISKPEPKVVTLWWRLQRQCLLDKSFTVRQGICVKVNEDSFAFKSRESTNGPFL